jgi:hypothetical protein
LQPPETEAQSESKSTPKHLISSNIITFEASKVYYRVSGLGVGFDFPMLHVWNMYRHFHPNWSQCGWIFHREAYGFPGSPWFFHGFEGLGLSFEVFGWSSGWFVQYAQIPYLTVSRIRNPRMLGECHTQIEVFGRRIHNPTIFPQNVNQPFYPIFLGFCWFNSHDFGGAKKRWGQLRTSLTCLTGNGVWS